MTPDDTDPTPAPADDPEPSPDPADVSGGPHGSADDRTPGEVLDEPSSGPTPPGRDPVEPAQDSLPPPTIPVPTTPPPTAPPPPRATAGFDTDGPARGVGSRSGEDPAPRRITRGRDRRIAGVASGLAEYLGIDPTIVRLGFVLALFVGGTGLVLYLVAWIVMPDDGPDEPRSHPGTGHRLDSTILVGLALLAAAAIFGFTGGPFHNGVLVPLMAIGVGVWLLSQRPDGSDALDANERNPSDRTATGPGIVFPPAGGATPGSAFSASSTAATTTTRRDAARSASPGPGPTGRTTPPAPATWTRIAVAATALWIGGAAVADQAGWIDVAWPRTIGLALVAVVATIAGAVALRRTRRTRGLFLFAIALALSMAAASVVEPIADDGAGTRVHAPTTLAELEPEYRLGVGDQTVDLRALDLDGDAVVTVDISQHMGHVDVMVPDDVDLELRGEVRFGELVVLDRRESGVENSLLVRRDAPGSTLLVVRAELSFGSMEFSQS